MSQRAKLFQEKATMARGTHLQELCRQTCACCLPCQVLGGLQGGEEHAGKLRGCGFFRIVTFHSR